MKTKILYYGDNEYIKVTDLIIFLATNPHATIEQMIRTLTTLSETAKESQAKRRGEIS